MALSESIEYDKIEVVGQYKAVQVRKATVIKKDGVELTRSFERFVLDPGTLDASDNLVDNPLDKEPDGTTAIADEVKAVCTRCLDNISQGRLESKTDCRQVSNYK